MAAGVVLQAITQAIAEDEVASSAMAASVAAAAVSSALAAASASDAFTTSDAQADGIASDALADAIVEEAVSSALADEADEIAAPPEVNGVGILEDPLALAIVQRALVAALTNEVPVGDPALMAMTREHQAGLDNGDSALAQWVAERAVSIALANGPVRSKFIGTATASTDDDIGTDVCNGLACGCMRVKVTVADKADGVQQYAITRDSETAGVGFANQVTLRRFRDFEALDQKLRSTMNAEAMPPLPEKHLFGLGLWRDHDETLAERATALEAYLNALLLGSSLIDGPGSGTAPAAASIAELLGLDALQLAPERVLLAGNN